MEAGTSRAPAFRRELGLLDTSVVVAGAIIGVGIFANPAQVARLLGTSPWIVLAWVLGGGIALLGGFAYAELASRLPETGGQYVYLVRAWHPMVGFLYGMALLFIINGGALAAVAMLFAATLDGAFVPLGPAGMRLAAAAVLVGLAGINVFGVRPGTRVNNALMAVKVAGIVVLIGMAFGAGGSPAGRAEGTPAGEAAAAADGVPASTASLPSGAPGVGLLLTALVPILFAYGGWQNCASIAGEIRDPARTLPRANIIGVGAVVVLYVGLNLAYLHVLTPAEMATSPVVAAGAARAAAGESGARFVSALILISSLGFLSVITLTGPRLYYAMAADGLFFRRAGVLHPRYRTPTFTIWLQSAVAIALLATNSYDELLSYVVFADWLFFGLTVGGLFVLRRRTARPEGLAAMPGHPFTTLAFVLVAVGIVINSFAAAPRQSLLGTGILGLAAAAYGVAAARRRKGRTATSRPN